MVLVPSLGFRGLGSGFLVQGSGQFRVLGLEFRVLGWAYLKHPTMNYELGTRNTEHLELIVSGFWFRVPGFGFGVHCFRVRVRLI